jgi:hypothetical protein
VIRFSGDHGRRDIHHRGHRGHRDKKEGRREEGEKGEGMAVQAHALQRVGFNHLLLLLSVSLW